MARYDWPNEFIGFYSLGARLQELLRRHTASAGGGLSGDLDLLDDIISANFEEQRTWLPLGPTVLRKGQAAGSPVVSGRVRAIQVSPDGTRVYVGAANGGVWYSNDTGQTWHPVGAGGLEAAASRSDISLTIGDVKVVFGATADQDIVYVGTGEAIPRISSTPGAKYGGVGVLRLNTTVTNAIANPRSNPWVREARNLSGHGIYRLAHPPSGAGQLQANGNGMLYAATSEGLFRRSSNSFTEDSQWTAIRVASSAYSGAAYCSDVVCTTSGVWATVSDMSDAQDGLYFSPTGNSGTFTRFALPGLTVHARNYRRTSIGEVPGRPDRVYVLGLVQPPNGGDGTDHARLWHVDRTVNPNPVKVVGRFPVGLFVSSVSKSGDKIVCGEGNQGAYDQAIAVRHQSGNDIVNVGGSTKMVDGGWNASIFEFIINAFATNMNTNFREDNQTKPEKDPTFRGKFIHADVHCLTYSGTKVWTGCDGGVFLRDGASVSSLNAGLATLEPGYIASHPTLDNPMLAGTQDNGAIRRIGDTVWELFSKGDGGGCLYHPTKPHNTVAQYTNSSWTFEPNSWTGRGPLTRFWVTGGTKKEEDKHALFYSSAATAPGRDEHTARIFIGTHRIWYADDWSDASGSPNWKTIPTGNDPAAFPRNDNTQDELVQGGSNTPDPVVAIRMLQSGAAAAPHIGQAILVLCARSVRIFRFARPSAGQPPVWTTISNSMATQGSSCPMCWPDASTDIQPDGGLNTMPAKGSEAWTDIAVHDASTSGRESFYITTTGRSTLNADGSRTPAANYDTLWWYDGNGSWHRTGLATTGLNALSNTGGSASPAHSVVVDPTQRNTVYVGNEVGVWKGTLSITNVSGVATPSWVWQPAMEGLPQALVQDLSIHQSGSGTYLRAALVSRGIWERDISISPDTVGRTYIRSVPHDSGRETLPATITDPHTGAGRLPQFSPDIALVRTGSVPWGARSPNEAEIFDAGNAMPSRLPRANHDIFVMVHHRHTTPRSASDIKVDYFLDKNPAVGTLDGYPVTAAMRTFITQKVGAASPAAGNQGDIFYLGRENPLANVDARNPRAAMHRFNLNYGGGGRDGMIIAVVTSPGNDLAAAALVPNNLRDVLRNSHQIAVRAFARA